MSLCLDFIERARWTWKHIKRAHEVGITPKEETITEMNLIELQTKYPHIFSTKEYNRSEETKIGADWTWEFWLGCSNLWLGLSIQAKKLYQKNLRYHGLNHRPKSGKMRQIDTLIQEALNDCPPKIPLYVFYNYWDVKKFNVPWLCGSFPKLVEMLGCSVSEAQTVKNVLDTKGNKLKDIAKVMFPWSCLVCCGGFPGRRPINKNVVLPQRTLDFINGAFRELSGDIDFPFYSSEKFLHPEAPNYVKKVIENQEISEDFWIKNKLKRISIVYQSEKSVSDGTFIFR